MTFILLNNNNNISKWQKKFLLFSLNFVVKFFPCILHIYDDIKI